MKTATRKTDDDVLALVRLRADGTGPSKIARIYGLTPQYVSVATNRIKRADIEHCGDRVAEAYW
jgi:transcriptional regulator